MQVSDKDNCPEDTHILIEESDSTVKSGWNFPGVLPESSARDWHCKWKVDVDSSLLPAKIDELIDERETNGWIVLEARTGGFDRNVVVVMQPPGKFYDYNYRAESTNPLNQSFMGLM